jgi:hypothetical protein
MNALPLFTSGGTTASDYEKVLGIERLLRGKFRHGYSEYTFCENWFANWAGLVWRDLRTKIDPEDVLNHPWAGCAQQGVTVQAMLQRLGLEYASIRVPSPVPHFASAAKIGGRWYFVDTWGRLPRGRERLIPVDTLLSGAGLEEDFPGQRGQRFRQALKSGLGEMGDVNRFPGLRGLLFQKVAWMLSYFGWLALLAACLAMSAWEGRARRNREKKGCRAPVPFQAPRTPSNSSDAGEAREAA